MSTPFTITRRVQVAQTDFAGVMHFAAFFPLMEECLHEYLRTLGISVDYTQTGIAWPRVEASCKYHRPLTFDDQVEIAVTFEEVADKVIASSFTFRTIDCEEVAATGRLVIAHCTTDDSGKMSAVPITDDLRAKLLP